MLRSAADRVLATLEEFGEGRTARERAQVCLSVGSVGVGMGGGVGCVGALYPFLPYLYPIHIGHTHSH